jgi:hypothetical protein
MRSWWSWMGRSVYNTSSQLPYTKSQEKLFVPLVNNSLYRADAADQRDPESFASCSAPMLLSEHFPPARKKGELNEAEL